MKSVICEPSFQGYKNMLTKLKLVKKPSKDQRELIRDLEKYIELKKERGIK